MPYNRISAMGVEHGLLSDVDKANIENARQAAMMQLQQAMQQRQGDTALSAAKIGADASRYGNELQFASQGSFADKAGLARQMEQSQTERAFGLSDRSMGPANKMADLEARKYQDSSALDNLKRQKLMEYMGQLGSAKPAAANAVGGAPNPDSPFLNAGVGLYDDAAARATPQFSDIPEDPQQGILDAIAVLNGAPPPDPYLRSLQRQQMQMGFDQNKLAQTRANTFGGDPNMTLPEYGAQVAEFGAKDDATIGWDPNQSDVQRLILGAAMEEQKLLKFYPTMKPEEAKQAVNKMILDKLRTSQGGWNTGWISEFLRQRGIAQ